MEYTYDYIQYKDADITDDICIDPDQDLIMRTWLSMQSTNFDNAEEIAYFWNKQDASKFPIPGHAFCIRRKEKKSSQVE